MFKKICKCFATFGCLLSVFALGGCGSSKESLEYSYRGEVIEEFEMVEMSAITFDITYVVKESKDEVNRVTSGITYSITNSNYSNGSDYEVKFVRNTCTFFNYRLGEGKYTFDVNFNYDGEEKTFDFKFEVINAYDYAMEKIASKVVERNNYDSDLGYCDTYIGNKFSTLFMVDNERDDTLEIFTIYSSGSTDVMVSLEIIDDSSFSLEYVYEVSGTSEAIGTGTYYSNSINTDTKYTPFADFGGYQQSTHESMAASLLVVSLANLHSYASSEFSNLIILSVPFMLGFTDYYFK